MTGELGEAGAGRHLALAVSGAEADDAPLARHRLPQSLPARYTQGRDTGGTDQVTDLADGGLCLLQTGQR